MNTIFRNGRPIPFGVGENFCPTLPYNCPPRPWGPDPGPLVSIADRLGTGSASVGVDGLACRPRDWEPDPGQLWAPPRNVGVGFGFHFNVGNLIRDVGKVASGAAKDVGKAATGAEKFAGKAASSAVRIAGESVTDPKRFLHDVGHIASDVVKIQKFVLEEAQGVVSLIPGVGTAISSAISAGLAVLEGGGLLIIAIKTAYGAIPIPVGIRTFTDLVLDAALVLVKKGTKNIENDVLLLTRTEIGKQLPAGAIRNVGLHVFDTLAHLIVSKLRGKPTQAKVVAPLSKEQLAAVQSGQPLPATVIPIAPTTAAYQPLAATEVAQSTDVTIALPAAGAAAGYGPYPQPASGGAPIPAGTTAGVGHGHGGGGGGGWHGGGGGGWHGGGGRAAFRGRGRGWGRGYGGSGWGWGGPWWPYVVAAPGEVTCASWGAPIDFPAEISGAVRATLSGSNWMPVAVRGSDGGLYRLSLDDYSRVVTVRPCVSMGVGSADDDVLRVMALDLFNSLQRGVPQYATRPVRAFAQAWNAASADAQIDTSGKYTREIEGALNAALSALSPGSGTAPAAVL